MATTFRRKYGIKITFISKIAKTSGGLYIRIPKRIGTMFLPVWQNRDYVKVTIEA